MDNDKPGCFIPFVSFLFPLIGIIIYITSKEEKPKLASSALWWAIIGVILPIIIIFIGLLGYFILGSNI